MIPASDTKRGRKYDQVIDGAAEIFMRDGFEGASVDAIARTAGVSKATLYSYFSDKKLLFIEVARREIARQSETSGDVSGAGSPRDVLTGLGKTFAGLILSPFGMSVMRVVIAEAERFPEVAREFYKAGPALMAQRMVTYFEAAEARGEMIVPDKEFAAHQFVELCKAGCHVRALVGVSAAPTAEQIAYVVGEAVEMFLARYGTD